jgi:hypothetical protein
VASFKRRGAAKRLPPALAEMTMKSIKTTFRLIVALLLVGGWGLAASALHVIWTGEKPIILPKDRIGIRDTYVNTSNWTGDDVSNHPAVSKRLVATGYADVLAHSFKAANHDELVAQIDEAIERGPTTQPADLQAKVEEVAQQTKEKAEHAVEQAKSAVGH